MKARFCVLALAGILAAVGEEPAFPAEDAIEREVAPVVGMSREGEDMASVTYTFTYRAPQADRVQKVRLLWNGGGPNDPTTVDYYLDGSAVKVVHRSYDKVQLPALLTAKSIAGSALKSSYTTKLYNPAPADEEQRADLGNLIFALASLKQALPPGGVSSDPLLHPAAAATPATEPADLAIGRVRVGDELGTGNVLYLFNYRSRDSRRVKKWRVLKTGDSSEPPLTIDYELAGYSLRVARRTYRKEDVPALLRGEILADVPVVSEITVPTRTTQALTEEQSRELSYFITLQSDVLPPLEPEKADGKGQ